MSEVAAVKPAQADTQTEQQKPVEPTRVETESDEVAKVIAQKDKGYEKMKSRLDGQIGDLQSQLSEVTKRFEGIEKQKTEIPKPIMPHNFNEDDLADRDSASAKYISDLTAYNSYKKEAEFDEIKHTANTMKAQFEQTQELAQQQEQERLKFEDTVNGFIDSGSSLQEAREMATYFFSPESTSVGALKAHYKAVKPKDRALELEERSERGKIPAPSSLGGGEHQLKLSDADVAEAAQKGISLESMASVLEVRKKVKEKNKR